MKRIFNIDNIAALLGMVMILGVGAVSAQKPTIKKKTVVKKTVPVIRVYTVATGTVMRARINQTITSKTAKVGDTFTSTVTEPVYSSNGVVVIPTGSTLTGTSIPSKPLPAKASPARSMSHSYQSGCQTAGSAP